MKQSNSVTKPADTTVTAAPAKVSMDQFASAAGSGMEGTNKDSFAVPFLSVLQKGSPQCDPDSGNYISGALPGKLFNTVTGEVFDGKAGVVIIPCAFAQRWIRWGARNAGGGFKGELTDEEVMKMRGARSIQDLENRPYIVQGDGPPNPERDDYVADTRNHYVIVVVDDVPHPAVLALGSTQLKKSKMLMSALRTLRWKDSNGRPFTPPTFGVRVRMTTVPESNEKGSWSGVRFEILGPVEDPDVYSAARAFHDQAVSGAVRTVQPVAEEGGSPQAGEGF